MKSEMEKFRAELAAIREAGAKVRLIATDGVFSNTVAPAICAATLKTLEILTASARRSPQGIRRKVSTLWWSASRKLRKKWDCNAVLIQKRGCKKTPFLQNHHQ